jgi:hypothetical protein
VKATDPRRPAAPPSDGHLHAGLRLGLPVGTTTIRCEATDAAGNTGRGTIGVTVRPSRQTTPVQRVTALKGAVERSRLPGVAQPLSAKLDVALKELAGKGAKGGRRRSTTLRRFEHM